MNPLPDDPWPDNPEAPRGEGLRTFEANRAVVILRSEFMSLIANGYRDEAAEFLNWAEETWSDAVWGRK